MKRPGYRDAIFWLANNDDCDWVHDEDGIFSVTAALVADMFGVDTDRVTKDVKRQLAKDAQRHD